MTGASSDWTLGRNDRVLEVEVAYLVRHAHAGSKHAWIGPDALRPLSEVATRRPSAWSTGSGTGR